MEDYQDRVRAWIVDCFGKAIADDMQERNFRFLEEALELVQSLGGSKADALALVEYVFDRAPGDPHQEVGGTLVCLAALCSAAGLQMDKAQVDELARISQPSVMDRIRAKHCTKAQSVRTALSPPPGR